MGKLAMGTESALTLQRKIQEELLNRGYSADNNDHVMAEYITIMLINDKTPDQISSELSDLIGSDYDSTFTEWLFEEAAKDANPPPTPAVEHPPSTESHPRRSSGGANLFQSALSEVQSTTVQGSSPGVGHKRTASARSPSPSSSSSAPNKARRTDTPTGPRAMMERPASQHQNGRSLIDRVGHGRRGNLSGHGGLSPAQVSQIQAKIDNITANPMLPMNGQPMPMNGTPGMNFSFQDMMMMNMDLMRQMASSMGMAPGAGMMPMVPGFGFPQPGMPQPGMPQPHVGPFGPGHQGFPGTQQGPPRSGGPGRGGMGGGRGRSRGGASPHPHAQSQVVPAPAQIAAPSPSLTVAPKPTIAPASVPERPSTPSLCKFGLKCTNTQCRYSHPSPVATAESGMVLSTEFCPQGKNCKDKDCKMGHVSPSVVNGTTHKPQPSHSAPPMAPVPAPATSPVMCKFGLKCTRPGCMFTHPPNFRPSHTTAFVQCRFGAGCTRGDCPFQHPPGHIPANMFYRGLGADAPLVEGYISPHKSVRFGADSKPVAAAAPTTQGENGKKDDKKEGSINKDKVVEKTVDVGA